jgi:phosphotransferase system HPr (HPr) family protein
METAVACSEKFVVSTPVGLHLRPAAMLAKIAGCFDCNIWLRRNGSSADAKSLMSIIMLQATFGTELVVATEGQDAEQAMAAIGELFVSGFEG